MSTFLASTELQAAVLEAAVTSSLAVLCGLVYRRFRKIWFGWFAVAFGLLTLRLALIVTFLTTEAWAWLFWHQVTTAWTALALLWAALLFSRGQRWRRVYLLWVLLPPVWSYVAVYRLDNFLLAAGPAAAFLSIVTIGTGWIFFRHWRQVRAPGAGVLALALVLWGLHYLDYPLFRARGTWVPWGYYLNILFALATGAGILLLLHDDLRRGLGALLALSGDLQRGAPVGDLLGTLLERPLGLPAVRGSALLQRHAGRLSVVRGSGMCTTWAARPVDGVSAEPIEEAIRQGRPLFVSDWPDPQTSGRTIPFAAVLPVLGGPEAATALLIVSEARDPFAALDEDYLAALGRQIGAALANADLYRRLEERSHQLERVSARMVRQHEEERRRLALHLHDETAQLFTAARLQLGVLREQADPAATGTLDTLLHLVDDGIRSIRSVTDALRPALLDELGLVPSLRCLAADVAGRTGLQVAFAAPDHLPSLAAETELAVYRALQEALANAARHAGAGRAEVLLAVEAGSVILRVSDDGRGFPGPVDVDALERGGHLGLAGMDERMAAVGGRVEFVRAPEGGARVVVRVPVAAELAT
jgi:signal transduction histidine kinase